MKKELDEFICNTYPKIFRDRHEDASKTAMCWGFAFADGWFNIVDTMCASIQRHVDHSEAAAQENVNYHARRDAALNGDRTLFDSYYAGVAKFGPEFLNKAYTELIGPVPEWRKRKEPVTQVVAFQVKEKWGNLSFYYDGGDAYIAGVVAMAEAMSAVTCEECGTPGRARHGSWTRTLCDLHAVECGYAIEDDTSDNPLD